MIIVEIMTQNWWILKIGFTEICEAICWNGKPIFNVEFWSKHEATCENHLSWQLETVGVLLTYCKAV